MADADIRVPAEVRDRLARAAAAEGLSLRAHLTRLANSLPVPAKRIHRPSLDDYGHHLSPEEEAQVDAELDRRIAEADRRFRMRSRDTPDDRTCFSSPEAGKPAADSP